jgi:hypothetical protein
MAGAPVIVWCSLCNDARPRDGNKIGTVVELPYPLRPDLPPRLLWLAQDEHAADRMKRFTPEADTDKDDDLPRLRHEWVVIVDPARPDVPPPDVLPAVCRKHGAGTVRTNDVLARRRIVTFRPRARRE